MMLNYQENNFTIPIVLSLIVHLIFFQFSSQFAGLFKSKIKAPVPAERTLNIQRISREDMKKYRTVGIKDGKKNSFNMPAKGDNTQAERIDSKPKPVKKTVQNIKREDKKTLDMKSLQPDAKVSQYHPTLKAKSQITRMSPKERAEVKLPRVTVQNVQRQRSMKTDLMKQLGPGTPNAQLANRSDIQVHFEPPEGVSQDELNSVEKMYYSFQKRTFEGYFNSFITTYNRIIQLRPGLKKTLQGEVHHLTGRLTFDKEGNIVAIKILRWSQDDNLQKLFEETLQEINSLPNPPIDILGKNEQFNIYYQLKIN